MSLFFFSLSPLTTTLSFLLLCLPLFLPLPYFIPLSPPIIPLSISIPTLSLYLYSNDNARNCITVISPVTTKADTTTPPSFSKPSISTITTTQDKTTQPLFPTTTTQDKTTQPLFPTTTTQDKTTQPLFPTTTTQDTTTQPLFSTTDDPTKVSTSEVSGYTSLCAVCVC